MPALPNVPNVIRATLKGIFGEDLDIVNRLFFQYVPATLTTAAMDAFATAIADAWAAHFASEVGAGYALKEVQTEDLESASGATGLWTGSESGTDSGVVQPGSLALVIGGNISRRYRGGHPRVYLAGISAAHLTDDQKWDPSYTAGCITAWGNFIAAVITDSASNVNATYPVNVSYYEGFHNFTYPSGRTRPIPTLRGAPVVDKINTYTINTRPASQRRRNLQGT